MEYNLVMNIITSFNQLPGLGDYCGSSIGITNALSLFNADRQPIYGSSYLASIGYDYNKNVMEVEFTDGAIYEYKCSDAEIDDILAADSRGQWFYYNVRTSFPFRRVRGSIFR